MKISKLRSAIFAVLFALVFAGIGASVALAAYQNNMINARNSLNSALSSLEAAQPDKGGHRNNAINLTKEAISQVTMGMQAAK